MAKLQTVTQQEIKQYLGKIVLVKLGKESEVQMEVKKVHKKKTVNGHINLTCDWIGTKETYCTDTSGARLKF